MTTNRLIRATWAEPIEPVVVPGCLEDEITEYGFRDLTWGMKLTGLKDQFVEKIPEEYEYSNGCNKLYSRKKENLIVYGVEAERIVYWFRYKKLAQIGLLFKYQESFITLRQVLEEKFGPAINGNYGFSEFIFKHNYIFLCIYPNSIMLYLREHMIMRELL